MKLTADPGVPSPDASPAYVAGHHWVSPFNFAPQAAAGFHFANPMVLVDSTLRKIVTTSGVRPSMGIMLEVARALVDVGVSEMIMNVYWFSEPTPSPVEHALVREVLAARLPADIAVS